MCCMGGRSRTNSVRTAAFVFAVGLLFVFVLNLDVQFFIAVMARVLCATQTL